LRKLTTTIPHLRNHRRNMCKRCWMVTATIGLSCLQIVMADSTRNAAAELENVRALPYGYYADCEKGHLKIRKKGTATFVIRDSILCKRKSIQLPKSQRQHFTLCSNDPEQPTEPNNRPTPKCVDLHQNDVTI